MHSQSTSIIGYRNHLTVLYDGATKYPSRPALKIPHWAQDSSTFKGWRDISFTEFLLDVETSARYWAHKLQQSGLQKRSIIGIWLKGITYVDIIHIWGLARAGFIPQVISLQITSPLMVRELLKGALAEGVIYDQTLESIVDWGSLPSFPAVDILQLKLNHLPLPDLWKSNVDMDIVSFYLTSGSTSGSPKLVPYTAKWLDFVVEKTKYFPHNTHPGTQEISIVNGSFCCIGCMAWLMSAHQRGNCVVLPVEIPYTSNMLQRMVEECGLTTLTMFSGRLGTLIREARADPALLSTLQAFQRICHGGLALDPAQEVWARENGINLVNRFGSTEVSAMLQSVEGEDATLRPFPRTSYEFVPISEGTNTEERLLELVVLPESPDCPHPCLRNNETGKFHTGDLFIEVSPGKYLPKGRIDDRIKLKDANRCDTRSIENNLMDTCGQDLVSVAVVVGSGRPSVALFVEAKENIHIDTEPAITKLKGEILRRITPFHERLYDPERIKSVRFINVVPTGTLPRAGVKGNVQRSLVEKRFNRELDLLYGE